MDFRIYSVHGTFAADTSQRGDRWWQKESPFSEKVLSYLDTETHRIRWEPYRWSGGNMSSERADASEALAQTLSQVDLDINKIALIAHSHGGNVAYAARGNFRPALLKKKKKNKLKDVPIVTVGTPFMWHEAKQTKIPELGFVSILLLAACLGGLLFVQAGTSISDWLVLFSMLASIGVVFSLIVTCIHWFGSKIAWEAPGIFGIILSKANALILKSENNHTRSENVKDPKIYSLNDEAINALRAIPSQKFDLATTELSSLLVAVIIGLVVFIIALFLLLQFGIAFPRDVVSNFVAMNLMPAEFKPWMNNFVLFFEVLVASTLIGIALVAD